MTTLEIPTGTRWSDRFSQPDLETLLKEIGSELLDPFAIVRESLRERGLREELAWHGPTYRWCLAYQPADAPKPQFYLVPRPAHPMLAAPITLERLAEIKTAKLDKAIREKIMIASVVGPVAWCSWIIGSKSAAVSICNAVRVIWDESS